MVHPQKIHHSKSLILSSSQLDTIAAGGSAFTWNRSKSSLKTCHPNMSPKKLPNLTLDSYFISKDLFRIFADRCTHTKGSRELAGRTCCSFRARPPQTPKPRSTDSDSQIRAVFVMDMICSSYFKISLLQQLF